MCNKLFGSSSGGVLGGIGDVVGGLAGAYFGGPVGAAAGAELGGTVGGVAGGEKFGQAALNALPAAGIAGVGTYAAEDFGGFTPGGGTDLFGVSGTPAAPSAVSAGGFAGAPAGSDVITGATDTTSNAAGTDGYIDPTTGLPVPPTPPATAPLPGAATAAPVAGATASSGNPISNAYHYLFGTSATQPAAPAADGSTPGVVGNVAKSLGLNTGQLLSAGIAGGGLIRDVVAGNNLQGQTQLTGQAAQLAQQSQLMQSYLQTGQLPPGVQTSINNATSGAQAAIRAKYASQGLSGSSMEQQELNQLQLNAASSGAQVAINLYSQGLDDAKISEEIYNTLLTTDQKQQSLTQQSISNISAALSGGSASGKQTYTLQPTPSGG